MGDFPDHFSVTAPSYATYRPRYPSALFAWLADQAADRSRVWDCGTGNGQAAVGLAAHFGEVIATDPSVAQLANAARTRRVDYVAMTAERAALADRSVDAVTVAQALHWFDRPAFFGEVERILRPDGIVAVWSYGTISIDPELDPEVARFYHETVGPYWPQERSIVDDGYAGIDLPFREESTPRFAMETEWTLPQLAGYVSTWSAVSRYRAARREDPVPAFMRAISARWGLPDTPRTVRWPFHVRMSRRV